MRIVPASVFADFDIFERRVLQVHDPGADGRDHGLGDHERLAEAMVEPLGDVAGDLDVLALVVADRHLVGVVEQDVGRLQGRVGEQAAGDELALALRRLVLELRHAGAARRS